MKRDLPRIQYVPVIVSNQVGGLTIGSQGTPFSHLSLSGWERIRPPARWNAISPIFFLDWTNNHKIMEDEYDKATMAWVSFRDYVLQYMRTTFFHHLPFNFGYIVNEQNDHTKRFLVYQHAVEILVFTYEMYIPILGKGDSVCGFTLGRNWLASLSREEWDRKDFAQRFNCLAVFIIEGFPTMIAVTKFSLEKAESLSLQDLLNRGYFEHPKEHGFQAGGP